MADSQESLHFLDYWRVIRTRKEIVIAVTLLVILVGVLVTFSLPKVYMASTVIQVKEEQGDLPVMFATEMMRYDPLFLRTQFELIQSPPVIESVIRKLGLNEKLGRAYGYYDALGEKSFDQTFKLVSKRMKVQQYRDTNLIEIQIYMDEPKGMAPQMAADIANEIFAVFREMNMSRMQTVTDRTLKALSESLEEQRRKVTEAESEVDKIRQKYQITLVKTGAGTDSELRKLTMTELEQARIRVQMELEEKKARYEKVMGLSSDQLREAAPYLVGDTQLMALEADKGRAEVELNRLLGALGTNHPDVVRVKATIFELDKKIDGKLGGLKTGVLAEYEAAKAKTTALESRVEDMKRQERSAESTGYREFDRAYADLDHLRKVRDALEMRYAEERIKSHIPKTTVEQVAPGKAASADDPVRPRPLLNMVLSLIVGIGAGIGLAYFVEYLDTSVKTIEDIESLMKVSVLGVIPQKVKPFVDPSAEAAHKEAYRVLRTNIRLSKKLASGKALCVTSGSVGEGKSLTVFNLAYCFAEMGDRTLVIDSDLHRPRQHRILGIGNRPGLANYLVGETPLDDVIRDTKVPNLHMIPSGKLQSGVHGLLASEKMQALVALLKERYDIVLLDSPPIIGVSDASLLVRYVDGVLLVIQHRKYPRAVSSRAKDMVVNVGANLLGVVLNNINVSKDYTYYYYQQHYYYYPRRPGREDKETA